MSPEAISAAWNTWRPRHDGKLGPGPAFVEAVEAALAVEAKAIRAEARREALEEAARHLEEERMPREEYGHAKAAVALDAAAIRALMDKREEHND